MWLIYCSSIILFAIALSATFHSSSFEPSTLDTAFRCAYCFSMNPARKAKPQPPRLTELAGPRHPSANLPLLRPGSSLAAPISVEATVVKDADVVPVDAPPAGHGSKTSPPEMSDLELSLPTHEEAQEESHKDADKRLTEVFDAVVEANEAQESKMAADTEFANAVESMETECQGADTT
uniref:Uncharacterized protein n=1 Tax=Eptatretus burgeri TaxID=7764 RepID=A0A8C4R3N2_EPTBU